jgi:hypothetical protein
MVYVNVTYPVKRWKAIIVFFVGVFSFSFQFPFNDQYIAISILPLGVWLLYGIYRKKESWESYRKFAWIGFIANYIFLIGSVSEPFIHDMVYPKNQLSTYISSLSSPNVVTLHASSKSRELDDQKFLSFLDEMSSEKFYNDEWYEELYLGKENAQVTERFPFLLIGAEPAFGSGLNTQIYLERDGKGVLVISSKTKQHYFRSPHSFWIGGAELD